MIRVLEPAHNLADRNRAGSPSGPDVGHLTNRAAQDLNTPAQFALRHLHRSALEMNRVRADSLRDLDSEGLVRIWHDTRDQPKRCRGAEEGQCETPSNEAAQICRASKTQRNRDEE